MRTNFIFEDVVVGTSLSTILPNTGTRVILNDNLYIIDRVLMNLDKVCIEVFLAKE